MEINWSKLNDELNFENSLFKATTQCINSFAHQNKNDETFYVFAYDLGLQQSHFGLCLNSTEFLEKQIEKYALRNHDIQIDDIKYGPGDWKYQAFNKFDFSTIKNIWDLLMEEKLEAIYSVLEDIYHNEVMDEDTIDELYFKLIFDITKSIESVLSRLKKYNCFQNLKTTKDFKIYWIHMQEDVNEIMDRIEG